jgi:hypothetical protein
VILAGAFDSLRFFYRRTLDLLIPQTALRLVEAECRKQVQLIGKRADKVDRINLLSGPSAADSAVVRAIIFQKSYVTKFLRTWIGHLDEFAHKAIARRDTLTANSILSGMRSIANNYTDARRTSLVLVPDLNSPLLAGKSDINDVLQFVHEQIQGICRDAAKQNNELVVKQCMAVLGDLGVHALSFVQSPAGMNENAPLAYSPTFYLKLCVDIAAEAKMQDGCLQAVHAFDRIVKAIPPKLDTAITTGTALDGYLVAAQAGYASPNSAVCYAAIRGMILAASRDLESHGYDNYAIFEQVLRFIEALLPLEVVMDLAGRRLLQTYPPYEVRMEYSLGNLLLNVAERVEADKDRPWVNPYYDFCEVSEKLTDHFRRIGKVNFGKGFVQKHAIDTLFECMDVHVALLENPEKFDQFIAEVQEKLIWMLSALTFHFTDPVASRHVREAADKLAWLGIQFLKSGNDILAFECAKIISLLGNRLIEASQGVYSYADVMENVEAMALAAFVLNKNANAQSYRALLAPPKNINPAGSVEYLDALFTRIGQFRDRVEGPGYSSLGREPQSLVTDLLGDGDLPDADDALEEIGKIWGVK